MTFSWVVIAFLIFLNRPQNHSSSVPIDGNGMDNPNPLTSHILDTARGVPAHKLATKLYKWENADETWRLVAEDETNEDGRLRKNIIGGSDWTVGRYKLFFDTKSYFSAHGSKTFYPYVEIVFEIERPDQHYHVPLILSPFGYTTYRGS